VLASAAVLGGALLLVVLAPAHLAEELWPRRSPALGLLLWQALGLAGGLLALELLVTLALVPLGDDHVAAVRAATSGPADVAPASWLLLAVAAALLARLAGVLLLSTARTLRARRRHRRLVDLVTTPEPALGARVVAHDVPVAYCLPGLRSRVVLSRGALDRLEPLEVQAVLAHERAHLSQRHDLVVLPFVALAATFRRLPTVRLAADQVALLVEMLADDVAARRHSRAVLAQALAKVGAGAPDGALGAADSGVLARAERLRHPLRPLPRRTAAAVLVGTSAIALLPVTGVLVPLL
jgi:Zn-dependent protease with chaperone function